VEFRLRGRSEGRLRVEMVFNLSRDCDTLGGLTLLGWVRRYRSCLAQAPRRRLRCSWWQVPCGRAG